MILSQRQRVRGGWWGVGGVESRRRERKKRRVRKKKRKKLVRCAKTAVLALLNVA